MNGTGPVGLVAKLDIVAVDGYPLIHLPFHSFAQPSHHSLARVHSLISESVKHQSRQGPPGWEVSLRLSRETLKLLLGISLLIS